MWPFRNSSPTSDVTPRRPSGSLGVEVRLTDLLQLRFQTRTLGVRSRKRVHALLAGGERSPFKGRGIDFEESRRYQPGDDVRLMDWRVMAKTNEPYVKVFREERERPVFMVVDDRASMYFGTRVAFKSVMAAHAAALLAWASYDRGDRVGAVMFSDVEHRELRPKGGRAGVLQLCHLLIQPQAGRPRQTASTPRPSSPLQSALHRVVITAKPGSLIFLISDFRQWDRQARQTLIRLGGHHEVVAIFIYDQLEKEAPPAGHYPVTDGVRRGMLSTDSAQVAQSYSETFKARYEEIRTLCVARGMGFIPLATHDDIPFQIRRGLQDVGHRRSAYHGLV